MRAMSINRPDETSDGGRAFADMYSKLGFTDSHRIAYRDVPDLVHRHCPGAQNALDHGSGAGRSTALLKQLGLATTGVDTNPHMIAQAKMRDPEGIYLPIDNGILPFPDDSFDLAFSGIVFVEIASKEEMVKALREIKRVLKRGGKLILLTSTPEGYVTDSGEFIGKVF